MLTLFSIPKPFTGHSGLIQRNAIRSWTRLHPQIEVILCGEEPGLAEAAAELGVRHLAAIEKNEFGTPLLNSAFAKVTEAASHPLLCYVNADIILMKDFVETLASIKRSRFLMVGRRWNFDLTAPLNFDDPAWDRTVRSEVEKRGELQPPSAIDYFVFPPDGVIEKLPPFAVGRPGWDCWFLYNARKLRWPVIDATEAIMAAHQNHDYKHVPKRTGNAWEGPEGDENIRLAGGYKHIFDLTDATHRIHNGRVCRILSRDSLVRQFRRLPVLYPAPFRPLHALRAKLSTALRVRLLRQAVRKARPLRVVLGAGGTSYPGWIGTDRETLDLTSPRDWSRLFAPGSIDRLLAEHVFEHLTEAQCRVAFTECFRFLKSGGRLRIAVPDGFRRDPAYVAEVSPPKDGHQQLLTKQSLSALLEAAGFRAEALEYFDEAETFQRSDWSPEDGMVLRSVRFDSRKAFQRGELHYTSLIVDACKP